MNQPGGSATFLFTDIEGSTRLWEQDPEAMRLALARHDVLLRQTISAHDGYVFKTVGDAFCAVFASAVEALAASLAIQQALQQHDWGPIGPLRVRIALHTGPAEERDNDYFGPTLNRIARLLAIGHGGQTLLSSAAKDAMVGYLPEGAHLQDLGSHCLKDLQLPERVWQLMHPALPAAFPPLRSLQAFTNNLPVQLTSFIGREREMQQVQHLLQETHLLTLTGPGGCGKTRLALQVAADLIEDYPDGVWLVELDSLSDPGMVPQALTAALKLQEEPGHPLLQTLTDYLQPRRCLLVLDNCEHLLEACAHLAASLLKTCPNAKILTTSREPLGLLGEQVYRIPSLLPPDPGSLPPGGEDLPGMVSRYDAVRLLVDRAVLHQPAFRLTPGNAPSVAAVCHRLDGIPLAIELAAARIKVLSVEEINARLDDRFRLLTGGNRMALPRQQTLRALIDWSYDLLTEAEKALLGRLSVFAGGWTLEAAEAICDLTPPLPLRGNGERVGDWTGGKGWDILDLLASLIDKSLALAEETEGRTRYRMLETIRQYAGERLQAAGEAEQLQERHLAYFLNLAEEFRAALKGPDQAVWLERLEAEHANLLLALDSCRSRPERITLGLRLAGALQWFWMIRSHLSEGRKWLAEMLAQDTIAAPTRARADALQGAGALAYAQSDYAAARSLFESSLAIHRILGDRLGMAKLLGNLGVLAYEQGDEATARDFYTQSLEIGRELQAFSTIASALSNLALLAFEQGDYRTARSLHEESLALDRRSGDTRGVAISLNNLGDVAFEQGDYADARAFYEQSLAIKQELGDRRGMSITLHNLGMVADGQKDYPAAQAFYEQSLTIKQELGDRRGEAVTHHNLGELALAQGDAVTAYACLKRGLELYQEIGDRQNVALALVAFAELAAQQAQPERAVSLYGAAAALREALGASLHAGTQEEADRRLAALRTALRSEAFQAAWEQGRAMTLEQAIPYALWREGSS